MLFGHIDLCTAMEAVGWQKGLVMVSADVSMRLVKRNSGCSSFLFMVVDVYIKATLLLFTCAARSDRPCLRRTTTNSSKKT